MTGDLAARIWAAAEATLPVAAGRLPSDELPRYRRYLKLESARIRIAHRGGGGGREIAGARAAMMDALLGHMMVALDAAVAERPKRVALVAVGGYGRGELNPFSDVDLLVLHRHGRSPDVLKDYVNGLLLPLWDLGLKVGHSVRTPAQCVRAANEDLQSKTALVEARRICGDEALFDEFRRLLLSKAVRGREDAYIASRMADQAARREKFGRSYCLQEPHLKSGCGGLRDYQNLLWMTFFKYGAGSLRELEERGFVGASDRAGLEAAYDFLLRVRTELHYQAGRGLDVLQKNLQPKVALRLGYSDRSAWRRLERFMGDLYGHLRTVDVLTRRLERRLALLPQPERLSMRQVIRGHREARSAALVDGFRFDGEEIRAGHRRVFEEQPRRLMRVFLHAQQRGRALHPDLEALIVEELPRLGAVLTSDEGVHETFLEILSHRGAVGPVLRRMHELGVLGRYLPEFGRLTCKVQHEFFHQYTVDEHTLVCVEALDRQAHSEGSASEFYERVFATVEHPEVLYLALLMHDTGKGVRGGKDHEATGRRMMQDVARRVGLSSESAEDAAFLVREHILMAKISQQRDMDDPDVIADFARQVGGPQRLAMLTLMTVADSMGTAGDFWNGFKDGLLRTLYRRARAYFEGDEDWRRVDAERIERLLGDVRRLAPATIGDDEIRAHFELLPARYFDVRDVEGIFADVVSAHRFMHLQVTEANRALEPVVTWHHAPDRGFTQVQVCTWDRAGLFRQIAGCLTASGINILGARAFTRGDGIVLDMLEVVDAGTGGQVKRRDKERFEILLTECLASEDGSEGLADRIREMRGGAPPAGAFEGHGVTPEVRLESERSGTRTIVDVIAEDRLGLLYALAETFHRLGLMIDLARITTGKGAVWDTFYVRERGGGALEGDVRRTEVREGLLAALRGLG